MVRLVRAVSPRVRRLLGAGALLLTAWVTFADHVWSFERMDAHRFTAKAILSGTLRLRSMLSVVELDEQIHDGAAYTNWGFGVPLLQAPFHAFAAAAGMLHGFFPDRAIYFVYCAAAIPVFWAACDRFLADRGPPGAPPGERGVLAWAVTWLGLLLALFPLHATRFIVYEETIAYFVVFELLALSAYLFARRSWAYGAVVAMGVASGVALLVRPTGLPYAALWALLVAREGGARKCAAFVGAVAPWVGLWVLTNHVRSGSYFGLGYVNSTPTWDHLALERFGSVCSDTPEHALLVAARLLTGFFLLATYRASDVWLHDCRFDFEARGSAEPVFGPVVLAITGWMVYRLVARREWRVERLAPYLLMSFLFLLFVRRGIGFAWRYAGDFWPAIFLAVAQHATSRARAPGKLPRSVPAMAVLAYGACALAGILYSRAEPDVIDPAGTAAMAARLQLSRWGHDAPLPTRLACGEARAPIYQNGQGWDASCGVYTVSNVLLGVAPKEGSRYSVRARTEGMSARELRVFVNGDLYVARRTGDTYEAEVTIAYERLASPAVVVTVEWTRDFFPPQGKLLWIELA